ncbi:uncharacterized protein V1510DRAFT_423385 [Dipodascopsis tothii]|uniref:uncharacterized protein n=1 Tax=Dipodascopsis tothii TaxID=44089 RepID=UPI0034CF4248
MDVDSALAANLAGIATAQAMHPHHGHPHAHAHHHPHHVTMAAAIDPAISLDGSAPQGGAQGGDVSGGVPGQGGEIDPKKTCVFCHKTFSHPGSLGRHLDLKRGTRLHPADEVDQLRGDVKRRGDVVEIKARRARRAKEYNARDDVKERAKLRRKEKERSMRSREEAKVNFLNRLGMPALHPHPSFPYMVLYFLPPSQWPHDPPTQETYNQLTMILDPSMHLEDERYMDWSSKAKVAFENWSVLNKGKRAEVWNREQRSAAEAALGTLTLFDLGCREEWLNNEEKRILEMESLM